MSEPEEEQESGTGAWFFMSDKGLARTHTHTQIIYEQTYARILVRLSHNEDENILKKKI